MKIKEDNLKNVSIIVIVWLALYILCQFIFIQQLGWDEVSYLSVAKGIATDFDFSSRAYTIMGLLKFGYPTNLINLPTFSVYLAAFLKLFGMTLKVAYFSTWLAALGVSIFLYFIFLILSDKNKTASLFVSLSYLLFPGNIKNFDTALMEQVGCLLLGLTTYILLKDLQNKKFNISSALRLSVLFLLLWIYKSIFIGFFFGVFLFILMACKVVNKNNFLKSALSYLAISYGVFAVLYVLVTKFVFLPVAPMMNFTPEIEMKQLYSDFLGGYFNDFPRSLFLNLNYLFNFIIRSYFVYPTNGTIYGNELLKSSAAFVLVGFYFFVLIVSVIFTFAFWKNFNSIQRSFIVLTLGTIISFNFIFNFLFSTTIGNIWRYNSYSLPLFLCFIGLIFINLNQYFAAFFKSHKVAGNLILASFIVFIYIPLNLSMILQAIDYENMYHGVARINSEVVKYFIKDFKPSFVYINNGSHLTWDLYPMKQVFKDATNEQLLQVNKILPEPIALLFLKQDDWLFKNNQELILKQQPILNGTYVPYGYEPNTGIVVYRHKG